MRPVIVESPFKTTEIVFANGEKFTIEESKNVEYAKACCRWVLDQGKSPYASHLLYTQMLDDSVPEQRQLGIEAGLAWGPWAKERFFFVDRGFTSGMIFGYNAAEELNQAATLIKLGGDWDLGWIAGEPKWSEVQDRLGLRA